VDLQLKSKFQKQKRFSAKPIQISRELKKNFFNQPKHKRSHFRRSPTSKMIAKQAMVEDSLVTIQSPRLSVRQHRGNIAQAKEVIRDMPDLTSVQMRVNKRVQQ
jgi:hypothetical protein